MKNVWQNALWCKSGNSFVVSVIRSIYEAICVMHTICLQWLWEPGCVYQVWQKSNLQSFAVFSATTWNVSLKFYMFMCCSCLHLTAKWHLRIYYVCSRPITSFNQNPSQSPNSKHCRWSGTMLLEASNYDSRDQQKLTVFWWCFVDVFWHVFQCAKMLDGHAKISITYFWLKIIKCHLAV